MKFFDEITAYLDDELKDDPIKHRMGELINIDCAIKQEFLFQKTIKELLHRRFTSCKIPIELKKEFSLKFLKTN